MKKYFALILSIIIVLSAFAGCSREETPEQEEGYFDSNVIWDRDAKEHWQNGENGEKMNAAAHELDELGVCEMCRCEITDWGDYIEVVDYNAFRDIIRETSYDGEGNVLFERTTEYEYDEYENYSRVKIYENGVLYSDCEYYVTESGDCYPSVETIYVENGNYSIGEYDENGNISKVTCYDENGEITLEALSEYSMSSDGWPYQSKVTEIYHKAGRKIVYLYNEQGDMLVYKDYDAEDNLIFEETNDYGYDDENRKTYRATRIDGKLTEEIWFGLAEDDEGWWTYYQKQIVYDEDGSCTVYEYDENDELISETHYDSEDMMG